MVTVTELRLRFKLSLGLNSFCTVGDGKTVTGCDGYGWGNVCSDQKSTQHEEADEVNDGEVAAAAELISGF